MGLSISGPLIFIGLAIFFAGFYRAATSRALHQHLGTYALIALGAGMIGAGVAMLERGMA